MVGAAASGGTRALVELIDEHGGALVADFQAHYGLRLSEVVFEWSPREVLGLVEGLIAYGGSIYIARLRGGDKWFEHLGWDTHRHAAADFWDLYVQAHTQQGKKSATYPRPGSRTPDQGTPLMAMFPRNKT